MCNINVSSTCYSNIYIKRARYGEKRSADAEVDPSYYIKRTGYLLEKKRDA
jgi:hypothetical protein